MSSSTGKNQEKVIIWDWLNNNESIYLRIPKIRPMMIDCSPDGLQIVCVGAFDLLIYDPKLAQQVGKTLIGHTALISAVKYSPNSQLIASGSGGQSKDFSVRVWQASTQLEVAKLSRHKCTVSAIAFSHDGDTIISGDFDSTVLIWNWKQEIQVQTIHINSGPVRQLEQSPDQQDILCGSDDRILILDCKTGLQSKQLFPNIKGVRRLLYLRNGLMIISQKIDFCIRLWRTTSGRLDTKIFINTMMQNISISKNQKSFISGDSVWNIMRRKQIRRFPRYDLRFSPDERFAMSFNNGDIELIPLYY